MPWKTQIFFHHHPHSVNLQFSLIFPLSSVFCVLSSCFVLRRVALCYDALCCVALCGVVFRGVVLCYDVQSSVALCWVSSRRFMLCSAKSPCAALWRACFVPCRLVLRFALWFALWCSVELFDVLRFALFCVAFRCGDAVLCFVPRCAFLCCVAVIFTLYHWQNRSQSCRVAPAHRAFGYHSQTYLVHRKSQSTTRGRAPIAPCAIRLSP